MDEKCQHCSAPCSMDAAGATQGWFCNCVALCPHADRGAGWYISTRLERVTEQVEAIYYVWADNPTDALERLKKSTKVRTERAIRSVDHRAVEPLF